MEKFTEIQQKKNKNTPDNRIENTRSVPHLRVHYENGSLTEVIFAHLILKVKFIFLTHRNKAKTKNHILFYFHEKISAKKKVSRKSRFLQNFTIFLFFFFLSQFQDTNFISKIQIIIRKLS